MMKILVIEDEQEVRENIIERLQAEGFETIAAEDGHVGVTYAWEHKPDLIICDIMMPELDGYEVLSLLRQEPATETIPFIFLSAKADKASMRRGMELGADDYLTKPFTKAELLAAIASRLERQAAIARRTEQKLQALNSSKTKYTDSSILANEFATLKQAQFTGRLLVKSSSKQEWSLYFYLGRILYATSGIHPVRRWQRNLTIYCPQIQLSKLNKPSELADGYGEYQLLGLWLKQQKITREQAGQIIRSVIAEVLFDIQQATQVMCAAKQEEPLPLQILLIDCEQALFAAAQTWQTWQNAKVLKVLPNRAPVLKRPELLQQQMSAAAYQQMTALVNGERTIREIALQLKRQDVEVASSLLSYIETGLIELVDVPDLPDLIAANPPEVPSTPSTGKKPLIACIDDSPLVCQTMEQILTEAGYEYMAIQDPLRAIAALLSRKPDLLFLDLVMPNMNGYEICTRLRKISAFYDTPIIILTGNIIDRVRAKAAGSSDYLAKPVKSENVLTVIEKYLSVPMNMA